jgi:flagellin
MSAKNASDALGFLKVVENASNDVTDMLQRVRELAVQAASGTNSTSDIKNLQGEADALMTEITRVSSDTTYNGKKTNRCRRRDYQYSSWLQRWRPNSLEDL